jgi:nucleotide-binding universal stress UspA family protein
MENSGLPLSPYQRILFCTDFSENADHAFDYAIDAAVRRPGCTLYLLHVIPEADAQFWKTYIYEVEGVDQKARRDIDDKIETAYRSRVPTGVDLKIEMRVGKASTAILEFAQEIDADVIVLGRAGRGSIQGKLFGTVTKTVARKARCAVLIIPLDSRKHASQGGGPT